MWTWLVQASAMRIAGSAAVLVAAGALAWRGWLQSPQGVLAWNGERWSWTAARPAEAGMPEAVFDLQQTLLLRWRADGGAVRWLWAERRVQPSSWDDLRRAVYSRVPL